MDWFVKAFLRSSVVWLATGVTLGIAMGMWPAWSIYRTAHLHMLLLGFVGMMIFGVAYHVLPRFTGVQLPSGRAAIGHLWLANAGLAAMVVGFVLRARGIPVSSTWLAAGGSAAAAGAYIFGYLVWRMLGSRPKPMAGPRTLPVK